MYKGIFWCYWSEGTDSEKDAPHIIATRVLCDADGNALEEVELSSKRGNNFNHKAEWERKGKDIRFYFGKLPYNYFPRGRVEINKGRVKIFTSPIIVGNISAQNSIIEKFCLESKMDEIQWKADNSTHYQYVNEYYSIDFDIIWKENKHWIVLVDLELKNRLRNQSKERQYKDFVYRVFDDFEVAKEYFLEQMIAFDYDKVIDQINTEIEELRLCEYEGAEDEVLAGQVCEINIDIDEGAFQMSGEAGRECVPNGWDVFYFQYFNSDYRFQVSENCFKMENPKDKYFFEITHFNSSTGEYDPHFYMELSQSL